MVVGEVRVHGLHHYAVRVRRSQRLPYRVARTIQRWWFVPIVATALIYLVVR